MAHNNQGQLPLADRGRAGGSLTDSIPELGELIPVDEFFQDYIGSLGRAPSFGQVLASRQGSRGPENGPAAAMPSSATSRGGQLGPQSRPMPPTFWQQGQQAQQGPPMQQQQKRNTSLENAHMAAQQAQQAQQAHAMQQLLSGANGAVNPALAAQYVSMLNAQAGFLGSGGQVTQELIRKLVQAGPALSMPPPAQIYPTRLLHQLQTPKGAPLGPNDRSGRNGTGRPGADGHAQRNSAPSGNDIHEDGDKSDTAQSTGMDGVSQQGTSKNNRTARQQLQNKQAQQRYRERRKRKVVEMEQAVTVMSQQVDELQTVLKQNVALQEKNMALEQALAEKDRQVAAMQDSLRQQPQSGEAGRPSGGGGSGEGSDGPVAAFEGMSDLKLEFQGQIMKLEHFIEMHNLRDADPFGANIAKDVLDAMNTLIEDGCRVCRRVQAEGVQVLNLIARDPQSLSVFATDMEAEKWSRALQAIKLAPMQKGQMLMWREEHLRNMADIYRERAALNLQAIGVMMPRKDHDTNTPLEECSVLQHVEDMQTSGYLQTAKSNLVLSNLLDEIKDNLKREQKLVLQFNWVLMNRILTPIQSALFMGAR
ncbi:hypothetical protein WJX72_005957 [[Myrmecia] bisecta]|uniref:BZIP domain-containing protein n=1 Tax=[Myrmecia] bisecta TaxID=41462 RepID=A0AAW1QQT6_9CHLO